MKTIPVLFFVTCLIVLIGGCGQKAKKAKAYHEQVLNTVRAVIDSSLDFGDAVQSYNKTKAAQGFEQYNGLVNRTIAKVKDQGTFQDDTILQHYALELLGYYQSTLQTDFKPFIQSLQTEDYKEGQHATADSLYANFTMTEAQYWNRFHWAEDKFDHQFGVAKTEDK